MKERKKIIIVIVAIVTLLVALIGATFAYFSATITETDKTETKLQAAKLGIVFDGTQEIEATSIEPGWSAQKKFTVENTSDYDMSFDINFTRVINTFTRTSDLTATGSAVFIDNDHISNTVQMIGLTDTNVAESVKTAFVLPTSTGQSAGKYTLPVDGSVDTSTTPETFSYGTNVYKVSRVFIPAHSKQEFAITFEYKYLAPTAGYTLGDPEDPNNQNVDQGKYFRTTISIIANGIDSAQSNNTNIHTGSTTNGEYPTNDNTDANSNNNQSQQPVGFNPTYYAFGEPTTSSPTEPPAGKNVYGALDSQGNKGVCLDRAGTIDCFQANNAEYEQTHVREAFQNGTCTYYDGGEYWSCSEGMYYCDAYDNGGITCSGTGKCDAYANGDVRCRQ